MRKNILTKNLLQSIRCSLGRFIAIVAIIALGAGIFVGLRTTKTDMIATGQKYLDEHNMFDLRLLNTYGWTQDDVDQIAKMNGVVDAEGVITMDAIAYIGEAEREGVYKLYAIPEKINKVCLLGGRMPMAPNECLVDGAHVNDSILGTTVTVSEKNEEDTLDSLHYRTYTVVGYISTPLFMDMSRGTTTLGNGSVSSYLYLPKEVFNVDYFAEIDIVIPGVYAIYSEEYNDAMDRMAEYIEPLLMPLAQDRYAAVMKEAQDAYSDGLKEYEDGLKEYEDGKKELLSQLQEAENQLIAGQKEIDANRLLMTDAAQQLKDAQKLLDSNLKLLNQGRQELSTQKAAAYAQLAQANAELLANYKTVTSSLDMIESGILQIDEGLIQINSGITQLENGLTQLDTMKVMVDTMLSVVESSLKTAQSTLEQAQKLGLDGEAIQRLEQQVQDLQTRRDEYAAQAAEMEANKEIYSQQLADLYVKQEELTVQRAELVENKKQLEEALVALDAGFLELENSQVQADNQFAAAEAEIQTGLIQIEIAQQELNAKAKELEDGKAELEKAQKELDAGWEEYRTGKDEALRELAEAELKLMEGRVELTKAKELIDGFTEPSVFALGRNTNVGYLALDSNSDIVEGVSAVFPAFFLLIAALVCITTMTRMVEEERTQIGTMKALGYSNGAIIGKYLAYAGIGALLGCGVGVLLGSVVFPMILWEAYSLIFNITPGITLVLDWGLCLLVVASYTAVTMLVTWYCCRMTLREVPAELIRPKPPTSGKKIFLEHLPFWGKISFLNKVMLRNIFRYRQRLLMMIVGIGGCTALLLTGFGIRDSIVDIVGYQFEEVTLYDMEVRFSEGLDYNDQIDFQEEIGRYVDKICYAHQSSVEMDFDGQTRDIVLIGADQSMEGFMDFHTGKQSLSMPGTGEALLSVGAAEKMGISVGDEIIVRNTDMQTLKLTVSGIYDNNVYNYVIVTPETIRDQWEQLPEQQMAYITVKDTQDVYYAGTRISQYEGVMNVTINNELARQVGSMLEALDLVVVTIVICAGMLAVTVLYNLTNINITERIREIATIKVLGFNSAESAAYVFKENLLLSAMGSVVGLFFGKLLLEFVMDKIKIDMVWFQARLHPMSYVWAIVLTMLAACIVDFLLYFKLEKINMAEALKSVE